MTVSLTETEHVNIIHYFGPKKRPMLCIPKVHLYYILSICIAVKIECPEYNGYSSAMNRSQGHSIRDETSIA